jgi:diguanylate cyclase (GGDEF)-like protein
MSNKSAHRVNLAHRLDTLVAILNRLEKKPDSEKAARELVTLIRASSASRKMSALAQSAQKAESASSADFTARLRDLIELMREEVKRNTHNPATVLIVSTDSTLKSALSSSLLAAHHTPITASTPSEALASLEAGSIGFALIDLVMDGADGRDFIAELRQRASTAAMPILAIGPNINNPGTESGQPPGADCFFEKPVDPEEVIKYLNLWLKRGYMRGHASRRDPTTGTPNRAGCHEAYQQIQKQCSDNDPISFAIVGIHRFNTLSRNIGPAARDTLIKQVGSILSSTFRATDIVARWSVSEFAIIMPAEDQFGSTKAMEKALAALNDLSTLTPSGKKLPVVLCAGVTLVDNRTPIEDAQAAAERHLFMAFHNAWHTPVRNQLVSDVSSNGRRSEVIALYLSDAAMARTLKQVLEHETFEVELFTSSDSLLARLAVRTFNLLILEREQPDDQRNQILERVHALQNQNHLRILAVVASEADVKASIRQGIQDYAVKPLTITAFLSRVRRLLWDRESSLSQTRMNILIVDHELSQLLVAGTTLHQLGECRVQLARGAQDAYRQLAHANPHVLLLDTTMPEMQAETFIKSIPESLRLAGMTIILAAPNPEATPLPASPFKIPGAVSRPYKPTSLIRQMRALIPSLGDESVVSAPVDQAPLDAEVKRIINLPA